MKEEQFRIAWLSGMTGRWKDGIVGVTVSPAGGMGSILKEWGAQETWDAQKDDVRACRGRTGEGGDTHQGESPPTRHLPLECRHQSSGPVGS